MLSRRNTLALPALLLPLSAHAQDANPAIPERAAGKPDAKVTVNEWFSLTCSHCAEFHKRTFPQVQKELIEPGRVRFVWRDYPLDQYALTAAMVARALPAERYEPFIGTLLASQDRWAFARNVNFTEELAKIAALAGMPREAFNQAVSNDTMRQAILREQDEAERTLGVKSTPTFVINGKPLAGAVPYATFLQAVEAAQG